MLADIDKKLAHDTENLSTQIHDEEGTELSVQDIRDRLLDPGFPVTKKDQYLRALVLRSQTHGDVWQSAVIHVMIPSLRLLARKLSRYGKTETKEADSEVLASFIAVLKAVDPEIENLEAHLHRTTGRAAGKALRQLYRESPVENIELMGALRSAQNPAEVITEAVLQQKEADRRTVPSSRQQVEGERWGAMIHRLGVHEKIQDYPDHSLYTHEHPYVIRQTKRRAIPVHHAEAEANMNTPEPPAHVEENPAAEISTTIAIKSQRRANGLTIPELLNLPAIVDLRTAAKAIDISIGTAYKLVHQDLFPCKVLRPGHHYKVPTAGLIRCLEIENSLLYMEDVKQGASSVSEEG
jgi:hypothetical protein